MPNTDARATGRGRSANPRLHGPPGAPLCTRYVYATPGVSAGSTTTWYDSTRAGACGSGADSVVPVTLAHDAGALQSSTSGAPPPRAVAAAAATVTNCTTSSCSLAPNTTLTCCGVWAGGSRQ